MNDRTHNSTGPRGGAEIVHCLTQLRGRGRLVALAGGVGWTLTGAALLLTALTAGLGWWGGSALRVLGWIAVCGGLLALAGLTVLRPLRRLGPLDAVARRIGAVRPDLASDVLSASQLALSPAAAAFSDALLTRHLRDVRQRLDRIPAGNVFPLRPLLGPALGLLVALGAALGAQAALPGVIETGLGALWSEPTIPDAAMRRMVTRVPVVGDLAITLRYPEYLRRPDRKLDATSGGLVAPLGTTVLLEGRSLVPAADRGAIGLPEGGQGPLTVRSDGRVFGRFVVAGPGSFTLHLGNASTLIEGPGRRLEVEQDAPPAIRLLRPAAREIELAEGGDVQLEFEAEDDHGLSRVDLVLRTATGGEQRKVILRAGDRVTRLRNRYRFSPGSVRFGEETQLEVELEAYDDDTILGPKPGRTQPLAIRIMTQLSRHRSALDEQAKALDALIDLLAVRLERPPVGSRQPDAAKQRFIEVRRATEDVLGRTARMIHQLSLDALTPRRVVDAFVQIREDLSNQLLHESRLHNQPLADFRKRQSVDRVTVRLLEQAVIHVDGLILEQQLGRLVGGGDRLEQGRRELATLIARFDETRAEPARRAVLEAIDKMEQAVQHLQQELEQVRGQVGDTFLNPSALEAIDLNAALAKLRALLAEGDVAAAARLAAELEQTLARLMAGLESGLLSFRTERFGEGDEFVGELLDRLLSLEADQLQLRRQTIALQRRYQERLVEVMRGRIDPLVKRQLDQVATMQARLEDITPPTDGPEREQLVALRVAARELRLALDQGDLDEARKVAEDLEQSIDDWRAGGDRQRPPELAEVRRLALRLVEEVTDAYPQPAQLLGERDRQRARTQANKQRQLTALARKLRAWIEGQGDETRFLSHRALAALKHVGTRMGDGVTALEEKRVRDALVAQSDALDELARLREDLKRGNEAAPLESRPVVLGGGVEIPDPGEYEVPPEFREDILEAMRGELPSHYREAIERYYETLVR